MFCCSRRGHLAGTLSCSCARAETLTATACFRRASTSSLFACDSHWQSSLLCFAMLLHRAHSASYALVALSNFTFKPITLLIIYIPATPIRWGVPGQEQIQRTTYSCSPPRQAGAARHRSSHPRPYPYRAAPPTQRHVSNNNTVTRLSLGSVRVAPLPAEDSAVPLQRWPCC